MRAAGGVPLLRALAGAGAGAQVEDLRAHANIALRNLGEAA